jgi:hypothetical protein
MDLIGRSRRQSGLLTMYLLKNETVARGASEKMCPCELTKMKMEIQPGAEQILWVNLA